MQIPNKIPTSQDRVANTAAAQAVKQTLTTNKNLKPGETLQTKIQDPKVAADVVKRTVDTTRGGVDVATAVKSIVPDSDAEKITQKMKKKMKKEHVFLTFRQYMESRDDI